MTNPAIEAAVKEKSDLVEWLNKRCGWYQGELDRMSAQLAAQMVYARGLALDIDALKADLLDALDLKAGHGPTALSMVAAERDRLKATSNRRARALVALQMYPSRNCWGRYGCKGDQHDDLCLMALAALTQSGPGQ